MNGWHFLGNDKRLGYGDGRKPGKGQTLRVSTNERRLKLCEWGLHASKKPLDALCYASGSFVARVCLSGEILHGSNKSCATERTPLTPYKDASHIVHEFACWCAERALRRAKSTDQRSWNAIKTKRAWLRGKATDDELFAAAAAAWDVARAAALAAVRDVARDASRDAAWAVAMAATRAAARGSAAAAAAAWASAWCAALAMEAGLATAVETKAQNRKLTRMLNKLLGEKGMREVKK